MLIWSVVYRNTLGIKNTFCGTPVFKNLLEKCVLRRSTNFRSVNENYRSFWTSSQRQISVTRFNKLADSIEKSFSDMKNILNNVLIFRLEKSTAYKVIMAFSVIQLLGMISMAINVHHTFCPDLFTSAKSWREKLSDHPFSISSIAVGIFCGPLILVTIIFFASRTIRKIILHKGGEKVTFVTYSLFPSQKIITESLENVSCKVSRTARATLPLKIKGTRFYYFIDTEGEILNENLFDFTVGLKRTLD